MSSTEEELRSARRLTRRGAATRDRIVRAAANLMYTRGANATTLDDVRVASGTSKSQFYCHFENKESLVEEVIALQARELLQRQRQRLKRLDSIRGLELWRDELVRRNALRGGAYGCELGSLASELADQDESARVALNGHFQAWQGLLTTGLERMVQNGVLRPEADPVALATGLMAALEGGYLLAQTSRDVTSMRVALDMAIAHVASFAEAHPEGRHDSRATAATGRS